MGKTGKKVLWMTVGVVAFSMLAIGIVQALVFERMYAEVKAEVSAVVAEASGIFDAAAIAKVKEDQSMWSEEYQDTRQAMSYFKNGQDIKYIYTLVKEEGEQATYLVDGAFQDVAKLGEEYGDKEELDAAFAGETTVTADPYTDEYGTFLTAYAPIRDPEGEVVAVVAVDKDVASYVEMRSALTRALIGLSLLLFLTVAFLSFRFSRQLSASLAAITEGLDWMGQGDLTQPLHLASKDEFQTIAEEIDKVRSSMVQTLGSVQKAGNRVSEQVDSLSAASEQMAASSQEVAVTVQQVAAGTETQSKEMMAINQTLEGVGVAIRRSVRENAAVMARMRDIDGKAQAGNQDLQELEASLQQMKEAFGKEREEILALSGSIAQISEAARLINQIADQTNLLSLNAAIEAARAGEAGKGFAVVAKEVGKLAEQAKYSAAHIGDLLETLNSGNVSLAQSSQGMEGQLEEQAGVIHHSVQTFREIMDQIEAILPQMDAFTGTLQLLDDGREEVVSGVESTTAAAEEVSASAEEIAANSEEVSASAQEVAASAQELAQLSRQMGREMALFRI